MMSLMKNSKGLSLVELLLVVGIIAALSMTTVSLVDNVDEKERYQETLDRLVILRSAILGPETLEVNGQSMVGGFLQDIGWPPTSPRDLLDRQHPYWHNFPRIYDPTWRTWYGWGGPYMNVLPLRKTDINPLVYDGWGNDFYGWKEGVLWPQSPPVYPPEDMAIGSYGADGASGGTETFDGDIPHVTQPLIASQDWAADFKDWQIEVVNQTGSPLVLSGNTFRFMIVVPHWSASPDTVELDFWPDTDEEKEQWGHIGGRQDTSSVFPVTIENGASHTFRFGGDGSMAHWVPCGRRMIFMVNENGISATPFRSDAFAEVLIFKHLSPPSTVKMTLH